MRLYEPEHNGKERRRLHVRNTDRNGILRSKHTDTDTSLLEAKLYIVVDRSQTTSRGEGTAGHTRWYGEVGRADSFGKASAVSQPSASGHSCKNIAAETE